MYIIFYLKVSDPELLKRSQQQQLQQQGKLVTQVQLTAQGSLAGAVYSQSAGVQSQQVAGTSGTAVVKPAAGTTVAGARTVTSPQIRQVTLPTVQQRKLPNQKSSYAHLKGAMPHLILQSTKSGGMTVQQIMKIQAGTAMPQFAHVSFLIYLKLLFILVIQNR